jgi:hypothetical protein
LDRAIFLRKIAKAEQKKDDFSPKNRGPTPGPGENFRRKFVLGEGREFSEKIRGRCRDQRVGTGTSPR